MTTETVMRSLFILLNKLYRYDYRAYQYLYFLYKRLGDHKKIALIKSIVQPGDVVVDIGANVGFYTLLLSKIVAKTGRVYAFEPETKNYSHLLNNVSGLKNIKAKRIAIGSKKASIDMYVSDELNVDHQMYDIGEGRKVRKVEMMTLDSFFVDKTKPSFIKIDIQGFEMQALKGMKKILSNSGKVVILSELWPYGMEKAGSPWREYLATLRKSGFVVKFFIERPLSTIAKSQKDKNFYTDILAYKNLPNSEAL